MADRWGKNIAIQKKLKCTSGLFWKNLTKTFMQFEKKLNYFLEGKEGKDIPSVLMHEDFLAIESRADFRRLSQRFKKEILNLKGMEVNEEVKKVWNDDLAFIFREAGGEEEKTEKSSEIIRAEIVRLKERVQEEQEIFPDMATYFLAKIAKLEESAGLEFETSLAEAKKSLVSCENIARENPSAYFSDAMILGIEVRRIKKTELPSKEKIAEEIKNNPKLIFDYALVLPESEREGFLKLLPEEKRREFSVALDSVSAEVLHASLIEKDSEEGKQRKAVVGRLRKELYDSLNTEKNTHKQLSKVIAQTIGELGEDARQILLEAIRDESENRESGIFSKMKKDNLPRVLKVMLDNFDDLKANDLILRLAGNEKINPHLSYYLLRKLVKREYLQKEVESWWKLEIKKKAKNKINAGAIFPHTIIKDWVGGYGSRTPEEIRQKEAQWKSLPDYHINGNVLGICDVSGSMEGEPLLVCIALGIYLAQHTKGDFHNYFITFSEKPKLQKLEGNNLFDNVSAMQHAEWGMSTNLESVFELLLKRAVKHSIPPDEMPNTLVIFSDMQFNQAIREEDHNALEMMKTRYKDAGYVTPNIIFWNLRASNGVPAKFTEDGIALVSGFSPSTMETILSGDINPVGVLLKTLEKYGDVQ
jgi:hypothetical protein